MPKYEFDLKRPLSWSSKSSWDWDREEWFFKYIVHGKCIREPESFCVVVGAYSDACPQVKTTKEMEFGKALAKSIEDGTCPYPDLMRHLTGKKEHPFKVMFGKIPLVGYADDFDQETFKRLEEVKTGKKAWDQKRVDGHGQIDMYLLMNLIANKIKPEEVACRLHWLPTQENGDFSISFIEPVQVITFPTKRTMKDILNFGMRLNKTYTEMQEYVKAHA